MQEAQEAAAETESQRLRYFRLVVKRCVVELELVQGVPQCFVLIGLDRVEAGKHLRLHVLEARQRSGRGPRG